MGFMKYLTLETFTDFVCTGSDCPYTCCGGGWNIGIDEETAAFYRTVEGEMGERLRNCIRKEGNNTFFILNEHGNCPFLNEKGLCDIILNIGEEHLSNTCTYYPRYAFYAGDICFAGVSISCPEVAKFYMTRTEPLMIDFADDGESVSEERKTDWNLFNQAIRLFTSAVGIAQNRNYSVNERLALIVLFTNGFQSCIDTGQDPGHVTDLMSDESRYKRLLTDAGLYTEDGTVMADFCVRITGYLSKMENAGRYLPELAEMASYFDDPGNRELDPDRLARSYELICNDTNSIWQENILVYILYKYLMPDYENRDFYIHLMTGLGLVYNVSIGILSLYHYIREEEAPEEYRIMLIAHLSRMIEHNKDRRDKAVAHFSNTGVLDPEYVLKLLF